MKTEAEANASADKEARERADKLNAADTLIFQTEKQISEYGEKIPAEKKEAIETAVADLKEAHKKQDIGHIDSAMEALNAAWQAASQEIYQAQQAGASAGANGADSGQQGSGEGNGEDVTDVEYEEVDDKKE